MQQNCRLMVGGVVTAPVAVHVRGPAVYLLLSPHGHHHHSAVGKGDGQLISMLEKERRRDAKGLSKRARQMR